ncbi:MAG TPA: hypothetical protein VHB18_05195 [Mycobacteriales bacterium]|nr:hypothetical protein [Mycobacteriales bacterium]
MPLHICHADQVDIHWRAPYPASALSNRADNPFMLDGVSCGCMQAFLEAVKVADEAQQVQICSLRGTETPLFSGEGLDWMNTQTLWWRGEPYERSGWAYQGLLDRAFSALAENPAFRQALVASGAAELEYSSGEFDSTRSVLTSDEFCLRLYVHRARAIQVRTGAGRNHLEVLNSATSFDDPGPRMLRLLPEGDRAEVADRVYVPMRALLEWVFDRGEGIEQDFDSLRRKVNITIDDHEWMDAALEGGWAAGARATLNALGEFLLDAELYCERDLTLELDTDLSCPEAADQTKHAD